jgi:tetratricopeptide (TPR) repeat protein
MKIKKKKGRPILKRARQPAEVAAETRLQKIFKPVIKRWKLIAAVAAGVAVAAGAVGGYAWYRRDREVKAARGYAGVHERVAEEVKKAVEAAGEEGQLNGDEIATKTAAELENLVQRFGDTAAGRVAAYELASLYFDRAEYKKALRLFSDLEGKSSGLEEVLAAKGSADCHKAVGDYDAAITKYRIIFESHKGEFPCVPAAMSLGECYQEKGQLDEAAKMYRYVLDYHGFSPYAAQAERELKKVKAVIAAERKPL